MQVKCFCPICGFQLTKALDIIQQRNGPANPPLGSACDLSFIAWCTVSKATEAHLGLTVNERNCPGIVKVKMGEPRQSGSLAVYSHDIGCKQCRYPVGYKNKFSHDIILSRNWVNVRTVGE